MIQWVYTLAMWVAFWAVRHGAVEREGVLLAGRQATAETAVLPSCQFCHGELVTPALKTHDGFWCCRGCKVSHFQRG